MITAVADTATLSPGGTLDLLANDSLNGVPPPSSQVTLTFNTASAFLSQVNGVLTLAAGAPPSPQEDPAKVLSINTSYFQVNAYAEVGPEDHRVKVKLYSVLQRKAGKIATLSRAQGFE